MIQNLYCKIQYNLAAHIILYEFNIWISCYYSIRLNTNHILVILEKGKFIRNKIWPTKIYPNTQKLDITHFENEDEFIVT